MRMHAGSEAGGLKQDSGGEPISRFQLKIVPDEVGDVMWPRQDFVAAAVTRQ